MLKRIKKLKALWDITKEPETEEVLGLKDGVFLSDMTKDERDEYFATRDKSWRKLMNKLKKL